MNRWIEDTLLVNKKELAVRIGMMNQIDLEFYPENPRLYSIVYSSSTMPSQKEIQSKLIKLDHVKQLIQSIKMNGGLTDPLIVYRSDDKNIVIEGNSRLAAYRALAKKNPIEWGKVKCKVLPDDITENEIFMILGEYHIIGKKDWAPYEQAGYLYRRHKNQNISKERIAQELGFSIREITHLISVYDFMVEHNELDISKWSYYDSYIRSNKIKKKRKEFDKLDNVIVKKIKSGEIVTAQDLRDKLPKILESHKKTINSFIDNKVGFYDSFERCIDQGMGNSIFIRLNKFRDWINELNSGDFNEMPKTQKDKCHYELRKIETIIHTLKKKMEYRN